MDDSTTMETGDVTLPDDAVADILRCLPAASLATARCVCKAWRTIIDGRELLLPHLLPHTMHGIFINYSDHRRPHLFACSVSPQPISATDGMLSFMPKVWWSIMDHCNGLLLGFMDMGNDDLFVCNPATRRWAMLPQQTMNHKSIADDAFAYLAFDPQVSPHYEVFLVPAVPKKPPPDRWGKEERERRALLHQQELAAPFCLDWFFSSPDESLLVAEETEEEQEVLSVVDEDEEMESADDPCLMMEWPPSPWELSVFSSRTGGWEERAFVRDGEPAGRVKEMRFERSGRRAWMASRWRYAVYWQGALYVHCQGGFIARFPMSGDKYQVIKMPANTVGAKPYLGRSEKGICFGIVDPHLRVWILSESCGKMEWVLKYQDDLRPHAPYISSFLHNGKQAAGPWMVVEDNNGMDDSDDDSETESSESLELDSDNDDFLALGVGGGGDNSEETVLPELNFDWHSDNDEDSDEEYIGAGPFDILGFHPYKEVVFLVQPFGAAAYDFTTSRIQYLGNSRPKSYDQPINGIYESFVYTPCMIGEFHSGMSSS